MLAGMNRKRKNAVNKDIVDQELSRVTENGKRPRGRPSKGGEAMRAKRYYVKKHLLILQKRKLRRYFLKVKKIIADKKYDAAAVKIDLDESCNQYKTRDNKTVSYNDTLHAVDLAREDRYLGFLNQDAENILNALPKNDDTEQQQHDPTRVEKLMAHLANKHSGRLFQLTTLWSAYLILHHVENEFEQKKLTLSEQENLEKMEATCLDYYEIDYSHLKGEELPDNLMNPELLNGEQEEDEEDSSEEYTNKKRRRSSCQHQKDTPNKNTSSVATEKEAKLPEGEDEET